MEISESLLKLFSSLIRQEMGIVYNERNFYQLEMRIKNLQKETGITSPDTLYNQLRNDRALAARFFDVATNNETMFYRDIKVFNFVKTILEEYLVEKGGGYNLEVWSCACSTGQEVYSLAMMFDELLEKRQISNFNIFASDISQFALNRAKSGIYSQLEVQRGLPIQKLMKHFTQLPQKENEVAADWQVSPSLKSKIDFQIQNLIHPFPNRKYDFIFCRNVLIYQSTEGKKDIVSRLFDCIKPGGYLLLGGAETLIELNNNFERVKTAEANIYMVPKDGLKKAS